jgi:hypothetical protein
MCKKKKKITRAKILLCFQIFELLRKSLGKRKHTESAMYMLIVWGNFDTKLVQHSTRANTVSGVTLNGFHYINLVHDKL